MTAVLIDRARHMASVAAWEAMLADVPMTWVAA